MEDERDQFRRKKNRVRLRAGNTGSSKMYDQVMILAAVLVAFFMIYTRGCDRSMQGLTTLLDESAGDSPGMGDESPVMGPEDNGG